MEETKGSMTAKRTAFKVLGAISFSHFLNDTIQSLIVAIYPLLKGKFELSFTQIGLITLSYQLTASPRRRSRRHRFVYLPPGILTRCPYGIRWTARAGTIDLPSRRQSGLLAGSPDGRVYSYSLRAGQRRMVLTCCAASYRGALEGWRLV